MPGPNQDWAHAPDLPLAVSPIWHWPPQPMATIRWYWDGWFFITVKLAILGLTFAIWYFASPTLEIAKTLSPGWIAQIFLRNFLILLALAGGLHLWFYTLKGQDKDLQYDSRDLAKGRRFTLNSQVRDNMVWSLGSGVTIWSLYEALMLWAIAKGYIGFLDFQAHPILFIAIFFLIPIWESFYFYWIHRFLHWPPLYRLAHALHHRNTNIGPWSGLSMHPVEHLLYFGSVLIHWLFASHPLHIIFHLQYYALTAVTTHTGFESLFLKDKKRLNLGTFHHQMHHRYFECNYGSLDVPWDKFFGSFHDGTDMAHQQMKDRRRGFQAK